MHIAITQVAICHHHRCISWHICIHKPIDKSISNAPAKVGLGSYELDAIQGL